MKIDIMDVPTERQFQPFNLVIGVESREELEQLILLTGSPTIDGALRSMGYVAKGKGDYVGDVIGIPGFAGRGPGSGFVTDEMFSPLISRIDGPLSDRAGEFQRALLDVATEREDAREQFRAAFEPESPADYDEPNNGCGCDICNPSARVVGIPSEGSRPFYGTSLMSSFGGAAGQPVSVGSIPPAVLLLALLGEDAIEFPED